MYNYLSPFIRFRINVSIYGLSFYTIHGYCLVKLLKFMDFLAIDVLPVKLIQTALRQVSYIRKIKQTINEYGNEKCMIYLRDSGIF